LTVSMTRFRYWSRYKANEHCLNTRKKFSTKFSKKVSLNVILRILNDV